MLNLPSFFSQSSYISSGLRRTRRDVGLCGGGSGTTSGACARAALVAPRAVFRRCGGVGRLERWPSWAAAAAPGAAAAAAATAAVISGQVVLVGRISKVELGQVALALAL